MFSRSQNSLFTPIENWRVTRSLSLLIVIATFFCSLVGSFAIIHRGEQKRLKQQRDSLAAIADDYSVAIQHDLRQTLSLTYALANLVEEYQGFIPNFESVAQDLFPFYQDAGSLVLFPKSLVSQKKIGAKVIGIGEKVNINLQEITCPQPPSNFTDSGVTDENSYPEQSLNTVVVSTTGAAKIASAQNMAAQIGEVKPIGLACLPVFLSEKTNQSSFWGFTSVLIDYSLFLKNLDWENLSQEGVAYQLEIAPVDGHSPQIIGGSSDFDFEGFDPFGAIADNPVVKSFTIAGETWTLSLAPVEGWQQKGYLMRVYLIGFLSSFLIATILKIYLDGQFKTQELEKITYLDPLTRLSNHRVLKYRLEQMLGNHLHQDQNLVLCHLNLDDFQEINQRFGSRIGDYLLVRIAKRLQKFLRIEDLVVRLDGDEFGILLQNIRDCEEAEKILERIMDAVGNPIDLEGETISISVSIGATIYPRHNLEINNPHQDIACQNSYLIEMLLNQAKQSLLQTKKQKGSYLFFKDLCQFNADYCSDTQCIGIESSRQD